MDFHLDKRNGVFVRNSASYKNIAPNGNCNHNRNRNRNHVQIYNYSSFFFLHLSCLFKQVFYIYLPHSIKNGNQDINYSSFMGLFMLLCVLVRIICCLSTRYVPIWYSLKIDKNLNQSHHTFYEIYNFDQYFNTHLINFIKIY